MGSPGAVVRNVKSEDQVPPVAPAPVETTLLALVTAISEVTHDEREVVLTVMHMIESGQVRLTGNFRSTRFFDI